MKYRSFFGRRVLAILLTVLLAMPAMAVGADGIMEVAPISGSGAADQHGGAPADEVLIVVGETQQQSPSAAAPVATPAPAAISEDVRLSVDMGSGGDALVRLYYFTIDGELFQTHTMQPGALAETLEETPPLEGHTFLFWYDYFAEEMAPFLFGMPVYEDVWLVPYYLDLSAFGIDPSDEAALENPVVQSIQEAIQSITDLGVEPELNQNDPEIPQERTSVISSEQDHLLIDEILGNLPAEDIQQTPTLPEAEDMPPPASESILEEGAPVVEETPQMEALELVGELDVDALADALDKFEATAADDLPEADVEPEPQDFDYSTTLSDTIVEILGINQPRREVDGEALEPGEEVDGEALEPGEETEAAGDSAGESIDPEEGDALPEEPLLTLEASAPVEEQETVIPAADVEGIDVAITLCASAEGDSFAPGAEINVGDTVYLKGDIDNLQNHAYSLRWQVDRGSGWETLQGVDGDTYALTISEENITWNYRLQMTVSFEAEAGEATEENDADTVSEIPEAIEPLV